MYPLPSPPEGPVRSGAIILQVLALAEAQKRRHLVVDLIVELGVVLVAVIADQQQRFVVIRAARAAPALIGGRLLSA